MLRESTDLFGTTLIRAGLATRRQVELALSIQKKRHVSGKAHKRLGYTYSAMGSHEHAVECFKKAMELEEV